MKTIKVKSYNKLIEAIKLDGDTDSWNGKLKKRIIDAVRLAKECKAAAEIARKDGNVTEAEWLEQRAADYEMAAKNWNQDLFDSTADDSNKNDNKTGEDESAETPADAATRAQNAANRAKASAEAAQQAAKDAQDNVKESEKTGTPEEAAKAKQKAQEAAEAADLAQQAADAAQQAADDAKKAADNDNAQDASNAADKAEAAEQEANDAAKRAAGSSDDNQAKDAEGSDTSSSEEDDLNDNSSNETGSTESEASDKNTNDSAAGNQSEDDANSKSDNDISSSEGDTKDTDSTTDNTNDKNNNKSSDSKSDSDSDSDSDDSDANDEDDNSSADDPIKDPFADDEDIPSLNMGSPNGKQPRDASIDDIIKQLQELDGEAKRGAIDGLKDLINKKNESLSEAFSKSIRDFEDDEWDSLNDETIDHIEKVKKITTIDDIQSRKANVKKWADNQVVRQELADEESQNIQKDVLKRRAQEKELDKYSKLETLKDFELDFESCIGDQVEMVMQEYQTYDEIDPETEGEDVIMKATVQRMLPSEVLPTIAVFFDQSISWDQADIDKGNSAIATVKQKYVDTGLCKMDIYYFSNYVQTTPFKNRGGTRAWPDIISTIKRGDYKNVVVMSDDDIGSQNNNGESYTVEGCVWWLWKDGNRADKCTKELIGMQHNFECAFY